VSPFAHAPCGLRARSKTAARRHGSWGSVSL